jgi:hypothetical protein
MGSGIHTHVYMAGNAAAHHPHLLVITWLGGQRCRTRPLTHRHRRNFYTAYNSNLK